MVSKMNKSKNIQVLQGNCLEVMDQLYEDLGESIDFIFADPHISI